MTESSKASTLRTRAEARLGEQPATDRALSPAEAQRLIHELRVHQVELEIQNEELREAQQQLATVRDRYRDLYDYAPVGYLTVNDDGCITQTNLSSEHLLGAERQSLLKTAFSQYVAPEAQDAYHFLRQRLQHTRTPQTAELQMVRADGSPCWVRLDATTSGEAPEYLITISDVTALHNLQEMERRMLYTVAHDLRVPATIIKGYLTYLLDMLPADIITEQGRVVVAALKRALQRMDTMVNDLSEVSYLRSGLVVLKPRPVTLAAYLRELLAHYAAVLDTVRITLEIAPELPPVSADPDRLESIFVNLLLNAQKYSTPPTPVRVSARQQGAEIVIAVQNQGQGLSPADLPHIFERFYRAEHGRKAEGIGLGLYITRILVEAHGGHIRVESTPGNGSTFCFSLPVAG